MRADQEVGQDPAWPGIALSPSSCCIYLESASGQSPNLLIQIKVDKDAGVGTKRVEKCFFSSWRGDQFGKYRCTQHKRTAYQSIVKGLLSGMADSSVTVPKG